MTGLAAVAALIAIAVAGCAVAPGPTAPATVASGPELVPAATIQDVAGDVLDLQDRPGATPAYIDVHELSAGSDGTRLQLTLTVADALPTPGPGATERLAFNLHLYAADPAIPENANDRDNLRYTIAVNSGSLDEGLPATYHPGIFDWTRGADPIFIRGSDFPGTLTVVGDTIVLTVSLAALGDPGAVWIGAQTVSTLSTPEGEALSSTSDSAPDVGQGWLVLEP
jgi:hypothetical protein